MYFREIGFNVKFAVRAIGWALGGAWFFSGKTDFHPVFQDKAALAIMPVSGAPEVLPAVRKIPGIRELCIHPRKRIRDFPPF